MPAHTHKTLVVVFFLRCARSLDDARALYKLFARRTVAVPSHHRRYVECCVVPFFLNTFIYIYYCLLCVCTNAPNKTHICKCICIHRERSLHPYTLILGGQPQHYMGLLFIYFFFSNWISCYVIFFLLYSRSISVSV